MSVTIRPQAKLRSTRVFGRGVVPFGTFVFFMGVRLKTGAPRCRHYGGHRRRPGPKIVEPGRTSDMQTTSMPFAPDGVDTAHPESPSTVPSARPRRSAVLLMVAAGIVGGIAGFGASALHPG